MATLTKPQRHVLDQMAKGWQLFAYLPLRGAELGWDDFFQPVAHSTFEALRRKQLISHVGYSPPRPQQYVLSDMEASHDNQT